ncbi:MAG: hypothetical protein GF390_01425 [Candidatus Pacebacteria bacterium]|nr:hypothetical protein [Candidatus Paceibacterota bacterium]
MIKKALNLPVAVITPDLASGQDFVRSLNSYALAPTLFYYPFWPRVVNQKDKKNILNPAYKKIADKLAALIAEIITEHHFKYITLACNTLSLVSFINPTLEKLKAQGFVSGQDFQLVTTLQLLRNMKQSTAGLFLGTTVLTKRLSKKYFQTLYTLDKAKLAELVQEIIWRVKAIQGSDVSTAPQYSGELTDQAIFDQQLLLLAQELKKLKISTVILGCTELPFAFERLTQLNPKLMFNLIDPADLVGQALAKEYSFVR